MSFLDKAKAKLTDAVDQHGDKIADGIDKAGKLANEKTGGKHADKIDQATGKAATPSTTSTARTTTSTAHADTTDRPPPATRPDRQPVPTPPPSRRSGPAERPVAYPATGEGLDPRP